MRQFLILFLIISGMMQTSAGQYTPVPLYDPPAPGSKDVEVEERRTSSENGTPTLKDVTKPEMWHFASRGDTVRPAVIICPGGGYKAQAYEHEGTDVAEWLASLGYHAFVLKYRLPDEELFTDAPYIPLADARQAILTIRQQSEKFGVDKSKIGIMGFSAGGHLAATASVLFDKKIPFAQTGPQVRPDFSILIYPVITMSEDFTHQGSKEALLGNAPSPEMENLFSAEKQVGSATPPTFILHAGDDEGVHPRNTRVYAEALRKHDVEVEEIILPAGGHGFGFKKESPAFVWTDQLETWLKETLD
ncbi:MAG: alpha/beta hydrolase [Marinilabiliaceae bacterium]